MTSFLYRNPQKSPDYQPLQSATYASNRPFLDSLLGDGKARQFIHFTGFAAFTTVTGAFSSTSKIDPNRLSKASGRGQPLGFSGKWEADSLVGSLYEGLQNASSACATSTIYLIESFSMAQVFNAALVQDDEWQALCHADSGDKVQDHSFLQDVRIYLREQKIDTKLNGLCWWSVASLRYGLRCYTHLMWPKDGAVEPQRVRVVEMSQFAAGDLVQRIIANVHDRAFKPSNPLL